MLDNMPKIPQRVNLLQLSSKERLRAEYKEKLLQIDEGKFKAFSSIEELRT